MQQLKKKPDPREPLPTSYFSLVIVQNKKGEFLAVKESRNRGWWIPGGRVEHGESLVDAAKRECMEEAGIDINIEGILRLEHSPYPTSARFRCVFFARPTDDRPPKSTPDEESEEARWVTLEQFNELIFTKKEKLRSGEPLVWWEYVKNGGVIYPLSVLGSEHDPVPKPLGNTKHT